MNDFSLSISGGTATPIKYYSNINFLFRKSKGNKFSENIANSLTWGNNEPNNSGGNENYAHIGGYSAVEFGKFLINDHQESLSIKHILELENGSTSVSGYTYLGSFYGHSYFLSDSSSGWNSARDTARNAGGYLLVINSQAEYDFLFLYILYLMEPQLVTPIIHGLGYFNSHQHQIIQNPLEDGIGLMALH